MHECVYLIYVRDVRVFFFFFSSQRPHTKYWRDWSFDVCPSGLYLRVETKSRNVLTKLVTSKSRVTSIKGETIPRLELMGVVLARLINSVLSAFKGTVRIDETFCWVDS